MSYRKFQEDTGPEIFDANKDPASLAFSRNGFAKLDVLKHPHVNSIVFLHEHKLKQLFLPTEMMVEDGTMVIAGWIGENPGEAVPASMVRDEFINVYPTYTSPSSGTPLKNAQGNDAVPLDHFANDAVPPMNSDLRATFLQTWFPKCNGVSLPTPLDSADWQAMEQEFDDFGFPQFPEGMYWATQIVKKAITAPEKKHLPSRKPNGSNLSVLPSMTLRLLSEDDISWFGKANLDVLKAEREKFRVSAPVSTSVSAPSPPSGTNSSAQSATDVAVLSIAKKLLDTNDKVMDKLSKVSSSSTEKKSTLMKTQALIRWRLLMCTVTSTGVDLPIAKPTFKELLDESKNSRLSSMRDIFQATSHEVEEARAYLYNQIAFPPINLTSVGLLFECEFCGTFGDDALQRGLTLFNFKAPDTSSADYKSFINNVNTVKLEETCGQVKEKCVSKVQKTYSDGKEGSREDIVAAIVNFLVIADCFVDVEIHTNKAPKPSIGKVFYDFAHMCYGKDFDDWVKHGRANGIEHTLHSVLAFLTNLLRAWVSLTRDLRLHQKIKSDTQTSIVCNVDKFNDLLESANLALKKFRHDMMFREYSSVAVVPPTFKVKEEETTSDYTSGGNRYKRQKTGERNPGGRKGLTDEEKKKDAFLFKASAQSPPWPSVPVMPDGSKICKYTAFSHMACKKGEANCTFKHLKIETMTKEEIEKFNKPWQNKYKYKLAPALLQRAQTLGCNMNGNPSPNANGGTANGNTNASQATSGQGNNPTQNSNVQNGFAQGDDASQAANADSSTGPDQ